jgi:inorganic pyrophosphatase
MDYSSPFLGKIVTVAIDRPIGSKHPKFSNLVYAQNYGHVEGVAAPDGDELDAYVLGESVPLKTFTGRCFAIIHRTDDNDDKLVVVKDGATYSDDQIRSMTEFQEKFFKSIIVRHHSEI